ncbi:MAG: ABC transporter ATP-binding protein [Acidobacteriota bacterium]
MTGSEERPDSVREGEAAGGDGPPVDVRNLEKSFYETGRGEVRAVQGVTFECRRGEVFGLLGANGAGKTTTLRMLSTVLSPSGGEARVMGHSIRDEPQEVRRRLGFHSASTGLYPKLTARETLEFFARLGGVSPQDLPARVEALIERFGIGPFANARVEKLSSGMKQKVALARTVAHDPPVAIFDEPTVGLDVLSALSLLDVVRELRDEGKAIVFSTHIMSEAEKLCDRIGILHGGRLLAVDTLDGLRETTGDHYLEDIFVRFVSDGEQATREALERRERRELEAAQEQG